MKHNIFYTILMIVFFGVGGVANAQQMTIEDNQAAAELVDKLTGEGVVVLNPQISCPGESNGVFEIDGPHTLGIDSGIILTSGRAMTQGGQQGANGPNTGAGPSHISGGANFDPDLSTVLTGDLRDVCFVEFDFLPAGDSISFDYVFASTEYQSFSCSNYNDVFGFFISGPGFANTYNMALIPGTNIPVTVNSTTGVQTGPLCTAMGPGSPFSQYYNSNVGGQTITYYGFTDVFTAKAAVSPCDTYHLKLAIADLHDGGLDSGVFLKAGSLTSVSIGVSSVGGGGLEYPNTGTIRGCDPAIVTVTRGNENIELPLTVDLMYGGTAINGVDYDLLPSSVDIPAGENSVEIIVNGIPIFPPVGEKTVVIQVMSSYNCSNNEPIVLAADTIYIYDSLQVTLNLTDTAICTGESVFLEVMEQGTDFTYSWSPLDNTIVVDEENNTAVVTPTEPSYYTVDVHLDVLGTCGAGSATVFVDVKEEPQVQLPALLYSCGATPMELPLETSPLNPDESYSWTPVTGLNDPTLKNPIANPGETTIYDVVVNPGAIGCDGHGQIVVEVLPDAIEILTPDQVVCQGELIEFEVNGHSEFSYNWNPDQDFIEHTQMNGRLVANESGYYVLTASYPGCDNMHDSVYVEVQPNPIVNVGEDHVICSTDTIHLFGEVLPHNYGSYAYEWTPADGLSNPNIANPIFNYYEGGLYNLTVTTPNGCTGSDSLNITVNDGNFLMVANDDVGICPNDSIQLSASGAYTYQWSPSEGLDNPNIANPIANPHASTNYKIVGRSEDNCYDSTTVFVAVHPEAVVYMPDSVTLYPGEEYWINPETNAMYFEWFPFSGLNSQYISNPVASPEVRTRYFVTAVAEYGCSVQDSIDVIVKDESVFDLPNAFNPKKGDNSKFKVERRGIVTLESFRIFNRWGQEVFSTTDINEGWDGKLKGEEQPLDVYVYLVEGVTNTGRKVRKEGNVTLLR